MADLIRLMLVDHRLDGECVAAALRMTNRFDDPIRVVTSLPAALDEARHLRPHVAVIGWDLSDGELTNRPPRGEWAIELTRQLSTALPDVKVLILGLRESRDNVLECIKAGAAGYVTNFESVQNLVERISQILRGETPPPPPHITTAVFCELAELSRGRTSADDHGLTDREREVWRLLAEGLSNKQIATRLRRSVHTIKNHVHSILTKLGAEGRHEAALAYRASAELAQDRGAASSRYASANQAELHQGSHLVNGALHFPALEPAKAPSN